MVKPFLSDKMIDSPKKKKFVEKNEIITNEEKIAEILSTFSLTLFLTSK